MKKLSMPRDAFMKAAALCCVTAAALTTTSVAILVEHDVQWSQGCQAQSVEPECQDPYIQRAERDLVIAGKDIANLIGVPVSNTEGISFRIDTIHDGVANTQGTYSYLIQKVAG